MTRWVSLALLTGAATTIATIAVAQDPTPIPAAVLDGFEFRSIGPAVTGGRIHDVEVHPSDPSTILLGTASGGIWKSTNKGTTWQPVFDGHAVSTFGDLAIAPSDPMIVYAGTGEQQNRQSSSWGNGIYRSDDGGDTWRHIGLENTRHIGRVLVHPNDPNTVYVAALGNLWQPSPERGIFRSTDGGHSWQTVLYVDELTGFVDMVINPENPEIIVVAAYQRQRRTWGFNGGGPGSGIHRSVDGGDTWMRVTDGIPAGDVGRIGLAISQSSPNVLMATIENREAGGTYRSVDGGASWEKMSSLNPRPMYYSHIFIDPTDANRVYVIATNPYMSEDGGRTFEQLPYRVTYDV
ncbi:MAG: sialidase family protein, partial [Gemmatimonadales bacterium]